MAALKEQVYFIHQAEWLQTRFPDGDYTDVLGLCKVVTREEIAASDDSLTPGRYVGVAPIEFEDDEVFEERMGAIHVELVELNHEATEIATLISSNFDELAI